MVALRRAASSPVFAVLCSLVAALAFWIAAPVAPQAGGAAPADREATAGSQPQYSAEGELKLPEGFETWVFVGANLGLEYRDDDEAPAKEGDEKKEDEKQAPTGNFHNVYINPEAYRHYLKTGEFPEGTILVLDIYEAKAGEPASVVSRGRFPGERSSVAVAVKNSARPDGSRTDWAYYDFQPGKTTAAAFPDAVCYDCHIKHADDDNVWVQFYPTLKRGREARQRVRE